MTIKRTLQQAVEGQEPLKEGLLFKLLNCFPHPGWIAGVVSITIEEGEDMK